MSPTSRNTSVPFLLASFRFLFVWESAYRSSGLLVQSRTIIRIHFTLDLRGKIEPRKNTSRAKTFPALRAFGAVCSFLRGEVQEISAVSFPSCGPPCGSPLLLRVNLAVDFEPARHLLRHLPHVAGVTACSRLRPSP